MMSVSSKPYSDPARWVCLYPIYINSTKKLEEGRRIPKSKVRLELEISTSFLFSGSCRSNCSGDLRYSPTCGLQMRNQSEFSFFSLTDTLQADVMHPRDPNREPVARGRVRVQLKNDDGSLCDSKFKSRKDLMLYVADLIPKLKSRQVDAAAPGPSQPTTTGGKKKKR
ncbi:SRP19 protein [Aphelenchoides besseyi]|nr:SRP19 protein [Aphelenchoides besseyi]